MSWGVISSNNFENFEGQCMAHMRDGFYPIGPCQTVALPDGSILYTITLRKDS